MREFHAHLLLKSQDAIRYCCRTFNSNLYCNVFYGRKKSHIEILPFTNDRLKKQLEADGRRKQEEEDRLKKLLEQVKK